MGKKDKKDKKKKPVVAIVVVETSPWSSQAAGGCKTYTAKVQLPPSEVIFQGPDNHFLSKAEALGALILEHPEILRYDLKTDG